jgi:hypothetical protein
MDINKEFEYELGKLTNFCVNDIACYRKRLIGFLNLRFDFSEQQLFSVSTVIVCLIFDKHDSVYIELELLDISDLEKICHDLRGIYLCSLFAAELMKRKGKIEKWEINQQKVLMMYPKSSMESQNARIDSSK